MKWSENYREHTFIVHMDTFEPRKALKAVRTFLRDNPDVTFISLYNTGDYHQAVFCRDTAAGGTA